MFCWVDVWYVDFKKFIVKVGKNYEVCKFIYFSRILIGIKCRRVWWF